MMKHETAIAWAAGFWDGEGYTGFNRKRIVAQVVQTNKDVLERFQKAVGFGKIYGPYRQSRPNHKDYWQLHFDGDNEVENLFQLLSPYLSQPKTEQFTSAIMRRKDLRRQIVENGNKKRKIPKQLFKTLQHLPNKELARRFSCTSATISHYRKELNENPSV